jgi:hypothetical protein
MAVCSLMSIASLCGLGSSDAADCARTDEVPPIINRRAAVHIATARAARPARGRTVMKGSFRLIGGYWGMT